MLQQLIPDIIALLLGVIGCCLFAYFSHIQTGINNNLISINHSVKDFFSYLMHWTLVMSILLTIMYVFLKFKM